ncbi:unnamed protein product [Phytophthora fragariaefolia]|uniref:Unnamed protein product n=1 Tax=Phytophthora fragariaefolia TaxID=1490495 RepID=A0A9W7DEI8_9STRA|nr:unnamed protein product [Phytophthora fragariaefolia]
MRAAMATTVLPALIYVLQNLLNHAAVVALDGVTFNVLNQTKIIWTALLVYVLLGRRQSPLQIVALALLCVAAVLMTASWEDEQREPEGDARATDAAAFTGMYQALLGAVLSALAGSIIQRALQREKRNQYMVTVELSCLGEMTLLALALVQGGLMPTTTGSGEGDSQDNMWEGWTIMTLAALMCQALGGVLVGFVIRDCGNVEKSFAVVGGMGLTALLETYFNGKPFGHNALVAMALVAISTSVYTLNPPVDASADEKPLVSVMPTEASVAPATAGPSSNVWHSKKKMSADTSELEPFLAPPTVVTVSSNSVHTSSTSRQEMRRSVRQMQPLQEIPTARRVLEAIV